MSIELTMDEYCQVAAALCADEGMKLENISNTDSFRKATRMGKGVEKFDGVSEIKVIEEHVAGEGESLAERKRALTEKTARDIEFDKSQLGTKTSRGGNRQEHFKGSPFEPPPNRARPRPDYPNG
jgi:hypothetical protein